MHHNARLIVAALSAPLLLCACAHKPRVGTLAPAEPPPTVNMPLNLESLTGSTWLLTHIDDSPISLPLPSDASPDPRYPSLTFDLATARIAGSSAVNRWSAPIDAQALSQGLFKPGMIVATKMASTPDRMQIESRFFTALSTITHYSPEAVDANTLTLFDASKTPRLKFVRTSAQP
jgi:heat shock protein HslJ